MISDSLTDLVNKYGFGHQLPNSKPINQLFGYWLLIQVLNTGLITKYQFSYWLPIQLPTTKLDTDKLITNSVTWLLNHILINRLLIQLPNTHLVIDFQIWIHLPITKLSTSELITHLVAKYQFN